MRSARRVKKIFLSLFFFIICFIIFSDPISQDNNEIIKLSTPILDNILLGIEKKDYKMYSRDFDSVMKEVLPESKFKSVHQQILSQVGLIKEKTYLGFLNKEKYTLVLWKGKSNKIKDDIFIQLVCSKRKGKIYVIGLWFK